MFQVVPPCGGHPTLRIRPQQRTAVSSRAPVWGASLNSASPSMPIFGFKSCPRVGGIGGICPASVARGRFKSCPRVGGIATAVSVGLIRKAFQVVPPCGGHPFRVLFSSFTSLVSSRAPVWGASQSDCGNGRLPDVSSRAPVWGASRVIPTISPPGMFQVVPPCGGHPQFSSTVSSPSSFQVVPPCGGHLVLM